jgi:hypothetical protein
MSMPSILQIVKVGKGRYLYELAPAGFFGVAGGKEYSVECDDRAVAEICHRITVTIEESTKNPGDASLNPALIYTWGRELFDAVMPVHQAESLRRALEKLQTPLLINTNESAVHWELLTDGSLENLFCFRYSVGRRLRVSDAPATPPGVRKVARCLIVGDPQGNLPAALKEAELLRHWLQSRGVQCDALMGTKATFSNLMGMLVNEYDILHYAGHGVSDALRLYDGEFSRVSIRNSVKGNPIVFINGCLSATAIDGIADAFIGAGARWVVGSTFDAPDEGAREFSEHFYQAALQGEPVGEAMRQARKHVKEQPAKWGPAWACFVLYGNPCLRIEFADNRGKDPVDELHQAVSAFGLAGADFGEAARSVLRSAIGYARKRDRVDTAHLFAAMVGGESTFLRDRLRDKHIQADALETAFREAFKTIDESTPETQRGKEPIKFSLRTQRILIAAKALAAKRVPPLIDELDLVRAFVAHGGGGTGEALEQAGISVQDFNPDNDRQPPKPPPLRPSTPPLAKVGPLSPGDCTPAAWRALGDSVRMASREGRAGVTSTDLYHGLLAAPDSELAHAFTRIGYPVLQWQLPEGPPKLLGGEVQCSPSVTNALVQAHAAAAAEAGLSERSLIAERHLVDAFVRVGGGSVAKLLESRGVILEAIVSDLFLDGGALDFSRFSPEMAAMCHGAAEFAMRKRDAFIGRRHLVHAALRAGGAVAKAIQDQGHDPELIADQLLTTMTLGQSTAAVPLSLAAFPHPLVAAFCRAERENVDQHHQTLTESDVFRAIFLDGGGDIGSFLTGRGVKLPNL